MVWPSEEEMMVPLSVVLTQTLEVLRAQIQAEQEAIDQESSEADGPDASGE